MNIVNHFSILNYNNINYILKEVGDFSNVSKVCRLFYAVASKEAESTLAAFATFFGIPCLARVIKKLGLDDKSYSAKIDGLFFAILPGSPRSDMSYNQDQSEALKAYMRPWLEADAVFKLHRFLSQNGDLHIQTLLSRLHLSPENDYFENVRLIRAFIKENSAELSDMTTLNLSFNELRLLPLELCHDVTRLQALDLTKNFLWELPKEMGNLSALTELRLNHNYLTSLPGEIGKLHSLENFHCSFNLLKEVPEFCNFNKLRMLNLSSNQLNGFPNIELGALNYLYLENNNLNSLPPSIGALTNLIGLYLHGNRIGSLPNNFCSLNQLEYLSLSCNALTSLPDDFGNMTSLRSLCINNNRIKELPRSFSSLKKLNQLFLYSNELSDLPEGMNKLKKLKLFCFENNPIEKFPDSMRSLPFWSKYPDFYPYLKEGRLQKVLNKKLTLTAFFQVYYNLGENKWKECIDGVHHPFGKEVYDKGLHGGTVEPGFLDSMRQSFEFLASNCNRLINADFYLELHTIACSHFNGAATSTLMGQRKVGKLRDCDDAVMANFKAPNYIISEEAIHEFQELDHKISVLFGSSFRLGDMTHRSQRLKSIDVCYFPMSRDQVHLIFNFFLTEFYYDIGHAKDRYSQVRAIAKFVQRLEWLHPVRDGCGRTDTAFLNFLLTCYGFNPVLFKFPYVSTCLGLDGWTQAIMEGMKKWRLEDTVESA